MFLLKLVLALVIIVAALILVFRFHKQLKGESDSLGLSPGKKKGEDAGGNDIEAFIAAYRRDKTVALNGQPPATPPAPAAPAPSAVLPGVASPGSASPVAASPVPAGSVAGAKARAAFLAGPTKLAFLVLKAGLPDHHVFAHTRMADLLDALTVPALANLHVDLVVCTKELSIVAAVDLPNGTPTDAVIDGEKAHRLSSAGIRYLRLEPGKFPKPAEVRGLIYPS
jgi:hypothetical protein